jgi:ribonuclease HI
LMVKQMRGQYKVRSEDLRPLFERARKMAHALQSFRIDHVYREQNTEADLLANQALDETSGGTARPVSPAKHEEPSAKPGPRRLRARFRNGALHPLEPLDLPEEEEVEITIHHRGRGTHSH